jgi:hypothetical protein
MVRPKEVVDLIEERSASRQGEYWYDLALPDLILQCILSAY